MIKPRRVTGKREIKPMAAVACVLAMAVGSAVVWVLFAAPAPPSTGIDTDWWRGLHVLPLR